MKNEKDKLEKNTISTDEEHLIIAGETEIREEVLVAKKDDAPNNVPKENIKIDKKAKKRKSFFHKIKELYGVEEDDEKDLEFIYS